MGVTGFFLLFFFSSYSLLHGSFLSVHCNSGHTHLFTAPHPTPSLSATHKQLLCLYWLSLSLAAYRGLNGREVYQAEIRMTGMGSAVLGGGGTF